MELQRNWLSKRWLILLSVVTFLLLPAVDRSAQAAEPGVSLEARQKLLEALRGSRVPPLAPTEPLQPVPPKTPEASVGKVTVVTCKRIDTGWKPALPLVFPGIGKMFLSDWMAFGGMGCHQCHEQRKLKVSWCDSGTIHRDGRWSRGGLEHTRHAKVGVVCLECHMARAR